MEDEMDINELAARIAAIEEQGAMQAQDAERRGFIDKYGTMFSGDEGIGMAIMGEMARRGIPAAAAGADRVIQEILDAIRQEATTVLDKIRMDTETVNALIDQVQDVQEAVDAAIGDEGGAPMNGVLDLPMEPEGAIAAGELAGAPMEEPMPVEGEIMEGTEAMPMGEETAPQDAVAPAEEEALPAEEEEPMPAPTVSDVRAKRIVKRKKPAPAPKAVVSDATAKVKMYKPPAHILRMFTGIGGKI